MPRFIVAFAFLLQSLSALSAADTVKIAHIDPASGPFANVGQSLGRHLQAVIDEINANGGVNGGAKLELINLDNKSSPQESILVLQQAIDQGVRSPYVAKIKASGADTVLTGNWGNDLSLLVRAGKEAGLTTDYYALYAYIVGSPTAIGESGANHVKTLSAWQVNLPANRLEKFATDYKSKYGVESLGLGWREDVRIEGKDTVMPTTCQMERPPM